MATVLIVDDERSIRVTLSAFLTRVSHHTVLAAESVEDALPLLAGSPVDVVLTDILLPGRSGLELLHEVRQRWPRIPVIVMTGEPSQDTARAAIRDRAFDYLLKPVGLDVVTATVAGALEVKRHEDEFERLQAENREYRERLERLVEERTAQLRESEERLELALRTTGGGVWDWNVATGALTWSPLLFTLFGLDAAATEASFATWRRILHPDDAATAERRIEQALQEHSVLNSDYRVVRPDGQVRWINAVGEGRYDDAGRPIRMTGICTDVTGHKHAESALRASEANYRSLFDNSLLGISRALPDGRLILANAAYARMYGYASPEEMIAEVGNVGQLYADSEARREVLRILAEKGVMEPREVEVIRRDGTRISVLVTAREIRDAAGNLLCYQAEHVDITARRQAERALQEGPGSSLAFREVSPPGCSRE